MISKLVNTNRLFTKQGLQTTLAANQNSLARNFGRYSRVEVIMVEDYPSVGFEGQVVDVKPKYALDFLIPNRIAVYNFPGAYNRLYPSLNV